MIKIGEKLHLTCIDYSSTGKGVTKFNNEVIFVDNFLLDEEGICQILYKRNGVYYAKLIELLKKSDYRINPKCKIHASCGGCQLQTLEYNQTCLYKKNKIINDLNKIGKQSINNIDFLSNENNYNYRNKIIIQVRKIGNKAKLGYFKEGSHELIEVKDCAIVDEKINNIIKAISLILDNTTAYDEATNSGTLKAILIRSSLTTKQTLVCLISTKKVEIEFINKLKEVKLIDTLSININPRNDNVLLTNDIKVIYGSPFIIDSINDIKFKIYTDTFFQVNTLMAQNLFTKAISLLKLDNNITVFDTYCGIGTIGMLLADKVKKVVGIEININSINSAIENAKLNNIINIDFINDDSTNYLKNITQNDNYLVILDPPRKGTTKEFLNQIIRLKIKQVLYISCDPATLARDLLYLKDNYDVIDVVGVDMFSYTYHVESIVILRLK